MLAGYTIIFFSIREGGIVVFKQDLLQSEIVADYLEATCLRVDPLAQALHQESIATVEHAEKMLSSPDQMQLLSFLVSMLQVERAIEIGVYTGYSSLTIAQAMGPTGQLIACDTNEAWVKVGRPYWEQAGVDERIKVHIAPALDTLHSLLEDGLAHQFDFIFLDADKIHYDAYYELALQLLRPKGLLVLDNTLFIANNMVGNNNTPAAKAVHLLNLKIKEDDRVRATCLPIGSGMMLVYPI